MAEAGKRFEAIGVVTPTVAAVRSYDLHAPVSGRESGSSLPSSEASAIGAMLAPLGVNGIAATSAFSSCDIRCLCHLSTSLAYVS